MGRPLQARVLIATAPWLLGCPQDPVEAPALVASPSVAPAAASEPASAPAMPAPSMPSEATMTPPAAPSPSSVPSPAGSCPEGMVDVAVACIDRYEAPNEKGTKPLLMQSLDDARSWCEARGKRLCTEDEWRRACKGPEGWSYPYGPTYDEHACNHDKKWRVVSWGKLAAWPSEASRTEAKRLDQSEPSGSRERCRSAEGVYDLVGNAAEWVVKTRAHPEACLTPEQEAHRHVVQGCYWSKCYRPPHTPTCDYVNCSHGEGFRSYEFGFRCCRDRAP